MPHWGQKLWSWRWQLAALALLLVALSSVKGGMAALGPLLKIAAPVGVAAYAFRFVKKRLLASAGAAFRKKFEDVLRAQQEMQGRQASRPAGGSGDGVIDLCPKCGSYLAAGHRCS